MVGVLVEPDDAQKVRGPDPGEQIGDLPHLASLLGHSRFRKQDRVIGEASHRSDRRKKFSPERDLRAEVVDVQPNPVDIRPTRPPWTQRWTDPRIPRSQAASRPHPDDLPRPSRSEYLVDMP